jgi:putative transposase
VPTDEGKLYLSTAIDLFSRRLLGYATSSHPDAELAGETIKMAVTARGGKDWIPGVVVHSDRGSTYTAHNFTALCDKLGIRQSMGRTGSCDNAGGGIVLLDVGTRSALPASLQDPERSTTNYCGMGRRLP